MGKRSRTLMSLLVIISLAVCIGQDCHSECCRRTLSDCQDYQAIGYYTSTVYYVTPIGMYSGLEVYCDMVTDEGGWLVFQRRVNGSENFNRTWMEYELGFGNVRHEHWLGLLPLRRFLSQGHYEMRIDIEDWDGQTKYAHYHYFSIGGPEHDYSLKAYSYSGTSGDALKSLRKQAFSTKDKDKDNHNTTNCAESLGGGWWYSSCGPSNLNGKYITDPNTDGIRWKNWKLNHSFKSTEMKIRRT